MKRHTKPSGDGAAIGDGGNAGASPSNGHRGASANGRGASAGDKPGNGPVNSHRGSNDGATRVDRDGAVGKPALPAAIYLLNHAGKAGTERYVLSLMAGARARGYRPALAYNEGGLLVEQAARSGVPCSYVRMRHPFDIAAARNLARICAERGASVVHTHYLRENYVAILAKLFFMRDLRVVHTNHFVWANGPLLRACNRLMTRANHRVIAVCDAGARQLAQNGFDPLKISVIRNAVDADAFRPGPRWGGERADARAALGAREGDTVFLCASRFAKDKGHRYFMEACSLFFGGLHEGNPVRGKGHGDAGGASYGARRSAGSGGSGEARRALVLLAGDGPLLGDIKAQAASLGLSSDVRFLGFVEDMAQLLRAADVYVNPSEHEASSFLIIEALASGIPVIATDKGGNGEIVNDANGCGELVEYGDAEQLAGAMARFHSDARLRDEAGARAVEAVERGHRLGDMLDRTFALYDA